MEYALIPKPNLTYGVNQLSVYMDMTYETSRDYRRQIYIRNK